MGRVLVGANFHWKQAKPAQRLAAGCPTDNGAECSAGCSVCDQPAVNL